MLLILYVSKQFMITGNKISEVFFSEEIVSIKLSSLYTPTRSGEEIEIIKSVNLGE